MTPSNNSSAGVMKSFQNHSIPHPQSIQEEDHNDQPLDEEPVPEPVSPDVGVVLQPPEEILIPNLLDMVPEAEESKEDLSNHENIEEEEEEEE